MFMQKKVGKYNEINSNNEYSFIQYLIRGVSRCFLFVSVIQLLTALIERNLSAINIVAGVIVSLLVTLIAWYFNAQRKR
ncbi:MAG: hypothetical protein K0S61_2081 [Anaerocolumna sp.]|jgi:uncharacterized membrane protein|nr:hypothetical protein [Anaerocolumna sp.]